MELGIQLGRTVLIGTRLNILIFEKYDIEKTLMMF